MLTSYDQLIYSSLPRPESQPTHLASIAKLFGLNSRAITQARILELGCGTGGNIIPLAELWTQAHFLGIDLSSKQIELGQKIVADLNLKNITLKQESILEFPENAGEFDYIICHGVFSWVTKPVQDKILAIVSKHLAPDGLAYISYNTLPGWRQKGAIREMMQYHTEKIEDPEEKAQQAKALILFLAESQSDASDPYSLSLQKSVQELQSVPSHYLFHEYLEQENQAFYFHEFVARLDSAKLSYVGDAQFSLMSFVDLPPATQGLLAGIDDRTKLEQYLDFIRNRKLRESIICRAKKCISYPALNPCLNDFYIASEFLSEQEEISDGDIKVSVFSTAKGGEIKSSNPLTIQALQKLQKIWPEQIKVAALIEECAVSINLDLNSSEGLIKRKQLEEEIFLYFSANLLELELSDFNISADYSKKPRASALARYQALKQERVTSLRHNAVKLESVVGQVLFLLDGSRDIPAIIKEMHKLCNQGLLALESAEGELLESDLQVFLGTIVERSLKLLAKHSFLMVESERSGR